MMTPEKISGANYGEYYPSGAGGTNLTLPPGYPDDLALFTRLPPDGSAYGVKGHNSFNIYLWTGARWTAVFTGDTDNFPVAFHPTTGELYVAAANVNVYNRAGILVRTIPGNVGANGIRKINQDGSIVTGDQTKGIIVGGVEVLASYTPLANGLCIGQGMHGGVDAWDGKLLRHICDGDVQIFNINDDASGRVAIYFTDLKDGYLLQTTITDIMALPGTDPTTPIGPTTPSRPDDGRVYNMSAFIHCQPAWASRGGDGQQANVQRELENGVIIYGKFGSVDATEGYGVDANWMTSIWDQSGPNEIQLWTDQRWFPMKMQVGEAHAFFTGPHEAIYQDKHTCVELRRVPFNRKMWLHALYDGFNWGPEIGIQPTICRVYDPTASFLGPDRIIERRWEALNAGWVRWEAYRSDLVYPNGWKGGAVFPESALLQRVDFYRVGGPNVTPALPKCTAAVVTPYPPLPPPTPPALFHHTKGLTMEIDGKTVVLRGPKGMLMRPDAPGTGIWKNADPKGTWRGAVFDVSDTNDNRCHYVAKKAGSRYIFTNAVDNCIVGIDAGPYSPDILQQFYHKPSGNTDAGDLEQLRVYDGNENGALEAQTEQVTTADQPVGAGHKFFSYPLAVELY